MARSYDAVAPKRGRPRGSPRIGGVVVSQVLTLYNPRRYLYLEKISVSLMFS